MEITWNVEPSRVKMHFPSILPESVGNCDFLYVPVLLIKEDDRRIISKQLALYSEHIFNVAQQNAYTK